jgi:adenylate cyclase
MTPRQILSHGFIVTVAVALLAAVPAPLFLLLDLRIYDTMLRGARLPTPSGRVAVVAIDDRSLSEIGQWPWPRDVVATLVERLRGSGAAVIALDMLLAEPDRFGPRLPAEADGGTDAALAAAVGKGRVVLGYALTFGTDRRGADCVLHPLNVALVHRVGGPSAGDQLFHAAGVTCSLPMLSRAAGASGYVNAGPDRDGLLRRIPLVMLYAGDIYPSLALASVRYATGARHLVLSPIGTERARLTIDGRQVPLDERGTLLIRFRGKSGGFPHLSASDVLKGHVPPGSLRDRIVFVGATALGTGDLVATPFETALPGIEVHASAAETLLQGGFIATPSYTRAYELTGTIAFGMTAAALVAVAGFVIGASLSVLLLAMLWWATTIGVTSGGVFLSPLFPVLSVVCTLAALTVVKVHHERRRADSERGRRERAHHFAVQSLTSLVETRDLATGRHARRTEEYTRVLGTRLARLPRFGATLTPEYVDLIARLAPLHDIGKVGVPDAILNKTGPLTTEEVDEIRRHPGFGHDAISTAARLAGDGDEEIVRVAKEIVYTHHERWDGKGYPRGLKGEAIPIGGRIMAVVDVYDALVESRTYRSSLTHDEAVAIIRAGRGTHFDPAVVDAFLGVESEFRRLGEELRSHHEPARA